MGYSESIRTVERRAELLGPLMEGKPTEWECNPGTERMVAYQVRECLRIAKKNPSQFPGLAEAASRMIVEIQGPGVVVARERRTSTAMASVSVRERVEAPVDPKKHLADEVSLVGSQSALTIINSWIASGGESIMHFPQANVSIEDLKKLDQWARAENVLLFWKDPMVTLRPFDAELAPHAFDAEEDLP